MNALPYFLFIIFAFTLPTFYYEFVAAGMVPYVYYFWQIKSGGALGLFLAAIPLVVYGYLLVKLSKLITQKFESLSGKEKPLFLIFVLCLVAVVTILPVYVSPSHNYASFETLCGFYGWCDQ